MPSRRHGIFLLLEAQHLLSFHETFVGQCGRGWHGGIFYKGQVSEIVLNDFRGWRVVLSAL